MNRTNPSIQNTVHMASLLVFWIFSAIWPQFFLFSKIINLPNWAVSWPFPVFIGIQVAFFSLAIIAMAVKNEDSLYKRILLSSLVMPISPVLIFLLRNLNEGGATEYLTGNLFGNYFFAFFICILPAIAVLALHEVLVFFKRVTKKVIQ